MRGSTRGWRTILRRTRAPSHWRWRSPAGGRALHTAQPRPQAYFSTENSWRIVRKTSLPGDPLPSAGGQSPNMVARVSMAPAGRVVQYKMILKGGLFPIQDDLRWMGAALLADIALLIDPAPARCNVVLVNIHSTAP